MAHMVPTFVRQTVTGGVTYPAGAVIPAGVFTELRLSQLRKLRRVVDRPVDDGEALPAPLVATVDTSETEDVRADAVPPAVTPADTAPARKRRRANTEQQSLPAHLG